MSNDYFIDRFTGLSEQIVAIVEGVKDGATLEWVLLRLGVMDGSIRRDIAEYKSLAEKESSSSNALLDVAKVAAVCCIDLDSNLESAHKEYMAGEIPNGAFQHVLNRHTQMHAALNAAGFTEKHPLFRFPVRPKSSSDKENPNANG